MNQPALRLALAGGHSLFVVPGHIDAAAKLAYTSGQCHALAQAMHERTGWPIAWLGRERCDEDRWCAPYADDLCACQIDHLGVLRPDGAFVDICGAQSPDALLGDPVWNCDRLELATPALLSWLATDPNWVAPDLPTARSFAAALLATLAQADAA